MSDKPNIHILSTRLLPDGSTAYKLLVDGVYYRASSFEYEMIRKGVHPDEIGMYVWTSDDEED